MEDYITGTEQKMKVHNKEDCKGSNCVIHNPSDGPMKSFPTHWRGDRYLMERICPHGIGHPDPDDIAYQMLVTGGRAEQWRVSVHGCDGCCIGV
jgi:hypothetical protein